MLSKSAKTAITVLLGLSFLLMVKVLNSGFRTYANPEDGAIVIEKTDAGSMNSAMQDALDDIDIHTIYVKDGVDFGEVYYQRTDEDALKVTIVGTSSDSTNPRIYGSITVTAESSDPDIEPYLELRNVDFSDRADGSRTSTSEPGIIVATELFTLNLVNSSMSNFDTGGNGGAISDGMYNEEAYLTILSDGGSIHTNSAENGAAVYYFGSLCLDGDLKLYNNRATSDGGAVYAGYIETGLLSCESYSPYYDPEDAFYGNRIMYLKVYDNSAGGNGGAMYSTDTAVFMDCLQFYGNKAELDGGAIYSEDMVEFSEYSFTDKGEEIIRTINNNRSETGSGGAIYAEGSVSISSSFEMNDNFAKVDGGALYTEIFSIANYYSPADYYIQSNKADTGNGGSIYATEIDLNANSNGLISSNQAPNGSGGAFHGDESITIYIESNEWNLTTTISENTALEGGAFYTPSCNINMGAIDQHESSLIIEKNQATQGHGGGIYTEEFDSYIEACEENDLSVLVIRSNTAAGNGGGIYASKATVDACGTSGASKIEKNQATNGGGIYIYMASDGFPYLVASSGSEFTGNTATKNGGAIYIESDAGTSPDTILQLDGECGDCGEVIQLTDNKAGISGGGIYTENPFNLKMYYVRLDGNQADFGAHLTADDAALYEYYTESEFDENSGEEYFYNFTLKCFSAYHGQKQHFTNAFNNYDINYGNNICSDVKVDFMLKYPDQTPEQAYGIRYIYHGFSNLTESMAANNETLDDPVTAIYAFTRWEYADGTPYQDSDLLTADTVIYGIMREITYQAKFYLRYSDLATDEHLEDADVLVRKSDPYVGRPEDPSFYWYHFNGWVDETGQPFDFTAPIDRDVNIIGMLERRPEEEYKVKIYLKYSDQEDLEFLNEITVMEGNPYLQQPTSPYREKYYFDRWCDENNQIFDFSTKITGDITIIGNMGKDNTVPVTKAPKPGGNGGGGGNGGNGGDGGGGAHPAIPTDPTNPDWNAVEPGENDQFISTDANLPINTDVSSSPNETNLQNGAVPKTGDTKNLLLMLASILTIGMSSSVFVVLKKKYKN